MRHLRPLLLRAPWLLLLLVACAPAGEPGADGAGAARSAERPRFVPPTVTLVPVAEVRVTSPVGSDCNRPSWWVGDTFYQMVSNQHPWRSRPGRDAATAQPFEPARFADDAPTFRWDSTRNWYVHDINAADRPTSTQMRWMESVWRHPRTGVLHGLYHLEEGPYVRCPAPYERPYLSVPHVGLARSTDGGMTWTDRGLVISDGTFPIDCASPSRFFTGGVGDPSMAVDAEGRWAYVAFTSYSGSDPRTQGIQLARIAVADLDAPIAPDGTSRARRWWNGAWSGPGLQGTPSPRLAQRWPAGPIGRATPILAPERSWQQPDGGGYWGPSLSWNAHVGAYLLLLNKVSGARAFDAEGNYLAWIPDMARPAAAPARPIRLNDLPHGPTPAWYVQALGDPAMRGTSMLTGQDARLFLGEHSRVLLRFGLAGAPAPDATAPRTDERPAPAPATGSRVVRLR